MFVRCLLTTFASIVSKENLLCRKRHRRLPERQLPSSLILFVEFLQFFMIRRYLQGLDIITVLTQEILYFTENLCAIFLNGDTAESGQREQVVDSPRNIIGDRKQRAVVQHGIRWLPYFKRFGITPFHKRVVQPGFTLSLEYSDLAAVCVFFRGDL